jgi:hypothetical protein
VDGRLKYHEFMADLEVKLDQGPHGDIDKSLVAPKAEGDGKPTVAEAVDALMKKGWAGNMPVSQVTSGRSNDYPELLGRVDKKFQD